MNNIIFEGLVYFKRDYYYYSFNKITGVECAKKHSIKYIRIKKIGTSIYIIILGSNSGNLRSCSYNTFVFEYNSDYKNLLKRNDMVEIKNG